MIPYYSLRPQLALKEIREKEEEREGGREGGRETHAACGLVQHSLRLHLLCVSAVLYSAVRYDRYDMIRCNSTVIRSLTNTPIAIKSIS